MRFNDGFWLMKSGVKPYFGLQVVQTTSDADGYNLVVSTRPIRHRGDTLGGTYIIFNCAYTAESRVADIVRCEL